MVRALPVGLGLLLAASGCLVELDHELSCGDAYVDELAGEECDPALPSSFEDACLGTSRPQGIGGCDPATCTIVADREQCRICGDGLVDPGEGCDGGNLAGRACPSGRGTLQCGPDCQLDESGCDPCGNGVLDAGEECDPADPEGPAMVACPELEPVDKPYAGGIATRCVECRWDRSTCNYCGDGERDGARMVDAGQLAPAEWCDGDSFDLSRLEEEEGSCPTSGERRNVTCGADCMTFVAITDPQAPTCCRLSNSPCPTLGSGSVCCHALSNPDDMACIQSDSSWVCR